MGGGGWGICNHLLRYCYVRRGEILTQFEKHRRIKHNEFEKEENSISSEHSTRKSSGQRNIQF